MNFNKKISLIIFGSLFSTILVVNAANEQLKKDYKMEFFKAVNDSSNQANFNRLNDQLYAELMKTGDVSAAQELTSSAETAYRYIDMMNKNPNKAAYYAESLKDVLNIDLKRIKSSNAFVNEISAIIKDAIESATAQYK